MAIETIKSRFERLHSAMPLIFVMAVMVMVGACGPQRSTNSTPKVMDNPVPAPSVSANPQGEWESSGGDGVACFEDIESANAARTEIKKSGVLGKELRPKIVSVITLERADFFSAPNESLESVNGFSDYQKSTSFTLEPTLSGPADKILDLALANLGRFTPLMSQRVKMVRDRLPLSKWDSSTRVPQVDDSKPHRPLEKNCILVQLANRFTKSHSGQIPETKIVYDKDLFDRMDEFNKALLIAHEYFYLVGKEGGHKNSDDIRRFNAFTFSKQIFKKHSSDYLSMRQIVGYPFGDYMRFFENEADLKVVAKPGSAFAMHRSLLSLMHKGRAEMNKCLKGKNLEALNDAEKSREQYKCQVSTIENNPSYWVKLTADEAFAFLGRFYFDQQSSPLNSEHLQVWDPKAIDSISDAQKTQARKYCEDLQLKPPSSFLEMIDVVAPFCMENFKIKLSDLKTKPLKEYFSCLSEYSTLIWHYQAPDSLWARPSINLGVDPNTGVSRGPEFLGRAEFIKEGWEKTIERKFAYGNVSYYAEREYKLIPSNANDELLIRHLMKTDFKDFTSMEIETDGKLIEATNPIDADARLSRGGKLKSYTTRLECSIRKTNLDPSAWYH